MNAELTYKTSVTNDPVCPGEQIICNQRKENVQKQNNASSQK